jgi:HAD superfamily hydrolase (TIGR01549 family)
LKYKGIFFDLFGTLIIMNDIEAEWSAWLSRFYTCLQPHGLSIPRQKFNECCERDLRKDVPSGDKDNFSIFERRIRAVCSGVGLDLKAADIRQTAISLLEVWHEYVSLDPECRPLLEELRRHKILGLITNFDHPPYVRSLLRELKLEDYFSIIVISGEYTFKKPDPKIFHLALEKIGLRSEEVIHIGDSEEDITGARAAGILPVWLQRNIIGGKMQDIIRKDSPLTGVATIKRLSELIKLLE